MTFKISLNKFAEKELELSGFIETEFGEKVLELLDKLADISNNDPDTMIHLCSILPRLVNRMPLAPITEDDFELETHRAGDRNVEIFRCTRYPHVYKMDGKYYDDRAIAFRLANSADTDRMYIYQAGNSSKQEITLPYFPNEEVRVLPKECVESLQIE